MNAIQIEKLTKTYKNGTVALNEMSLEVRQGEVFTLLGPNSAGKSTLINILTTYLRPTAGEVRILGKDLEREPAAIRRTISCVAQRVSIDGHMTLGENMMFQGRLYRLDKAVIQERMDKLIDSFGLGAYTYKRVMNYSGGILRRLDIAMSMMPMPKILFLDEPTVGMDIESRQAMWKLVRQISGEYGTTVFLTTHYLDEADFLSDTICVMRSGQRVAQDTPQNLKRYTNQPIVRVSCDTPQAAAAFASKLDVCDFVEKTMCADSGLTVLVKDAQRDYRQILQMALDGQVPQSGVEIAAPTMDDVFLALTQERSV